MYTVGSGLEYVRAVSNQTRSRLSSLLLGRLRLGMVVDVFGNDNGKDVSWEKPVSVLETYKNHHWWRYLRWVSSQPDAAHKVNYARYLCRSWNSNHNGSEKLEGDWRFFSCLKLLSRTTSTSNRSDG